MSEPKNKIRFLSYNIDGISHLDDRLRFLEWCKSKYDIILLNEIKSKYPLEGRVHPYYCAVCNIPTSKVAKWGSAIVYNKDLQIIDIVKGKKLLKGRTVSMGLVVKSSTKQLIIRIVSNYTPQSKEMQLEYYKSLTDWLSKQKKDYTIVAGDLNGLVTVKGKFDSRNAKYEGESNIYLSNFVQENNFEVLTDWDARTNWTHSPYAYPNIQQVIDHVLVSEKGIVKNVKIVKDIPHEFNSDHLPIEFELDVEALGFIVEHDQEDQFVHRIRTSEKYRRHFEKRCNQYWDSIENSLKGIFSSNNPVKRYGDELCISRLQDAISTFTYAAVDIAKEVFLKKMKRVKKPLCNSVIGEQLRKIRWSYTAIRSAFMIAEEFSGKNHHNLKRNLELPEGVDIDDIPRIPENITIDSVTEWYGKIKEVRKHWHKVVKFERKRMLAQCYEQAHKRNQRLFLKNDKKFRSYVYSKPFSRFPKAFRKNDEWIVETKAVADHVANYFEENSKRRKVSLFGKSPTITIHPPIEDWSAIGNPSFELFNAIINGTRNSAPGRDGIQNSVVKLMPMNWRKFLHGIVSTIIVTRHIPVDLKIGEIVPLFKDGDVYTIENYRGVTLLNVIFKYATAIINYELEKKLSQLDRLSHVQSAKKGSHCPMKVATLVAAMKNVKKRGGDAYAIAVDVVRAFDRVPIEGIIDGLKFLGVQDFETLDFVEEMMKFSKSVVRLSNGYSRIINLEVGIKQGDILSPLLFKIWLEPLLQHLEDKFDGIIVDGVRIPAIAWVDDIILVSENMNELEKMFDTLQGFLSKYDMEIAVGKTHFISTNSTIQKFCWKELEFRNEERIKYLGMWITRDLSWSFQLKCLTNIIRNAVNKIFKAKTTLDQTVSLVKSDVIPIARYFLPVVTHDHKTFKAWDEIIEKMIKRKHKLRHLPSFAFWADKNIGGMQIEKMSDISKMEKVSLLYKMLNTNDTQARSVVKYTLTELERDSGIKSIGFCWPRRFRRNYYKDYLDSFVTAIHTLRSLGLTLIWQKLPKVNDITIQEIKLHVESDLMRTRICNKLMKQGITRASQISSWFVRKTSTTSKIERIILGIFSARGYEWDVVDKYNRGTVNEMKALKTMFRDFIKIVREKRNKWIYRLDGHIVECLHRSNFLIKSVRHEYPIVATDGSLKTTIMGKTAAAAVVNNEGNLIISGRVLGEQSIIRAELSAILAAIKTWNGRGELTVLSDSASAIKLIEFVRSRGFSYDMIGKVKNRSIIREIVELMSVGRINIQHVKSHTNKDDWKSILNTYADIEAKRAVLSIQSLLWNSKLYADEWFMIDETGIVEDNLRKVVKKKLDSQIREVTKEHALAPGFCNQWCVSRTSWTFIKSRDVDHATRRFYYLLNFGVIDRYVNKWAKGRICRCCDEPCIWAHIVANCYCCDDDRQNMINELKSIIRKVSGKGTKDFTERTLRYLLSGLDCEPLWIYGLIHKRFEIWLLYQGISHRRVTAMLKKIQLALIKNLRKMWITWIRNEVKCINPRR
jgi:exonuclease III/ribonuclease HI